jgi:hypothetical protein
VKYGSIFTGGRQSQKAPPDSKMSYFADLANLDLVPHPNLHNQTVRIAAKLLRRKKKKMPGKPGISKP